MIVRRVRFRDLAERGIVSNRVTLRNWILDRGFPPGQLTGPHLRTWSEDEVQAWLDTRPTVNSAPLQGAVAARRGRPRKVTGETHPQS